MTKKDFEAVAKVIADLGINERDRDVVAIRLADIFGKLNPRFDAARFIYACGVR